MKISVGFRGLESEIAPYPEVFFFCCCPYGEGVYGLLYSVSVISFSISLVLNISPQYLPLNLSPSISPPQYLPLNLSPSISPPQSLPLNLSPSISPPQYLLQTPPTHNLSPSIFPPQFLPFNLLPSVSHLYLSLIVVSHFFSNLSDLQ